MNEVENQYSITGTRGAPSAIEAVVFDFDDTLADTLLARIHAMRQTFAWAGITKPTADVFVTEQRGVPLQVSLGAFETTRGLSMGMLDIYRAAYWLKEPGLLRLFNGVPQLLAALRATNVPIGILTSKARDIVVEGRAAGTLVELNELGLNWLAPHTVGFEDVAQAKPHPEGLLRLLDNLGVTPEVSLMVGDSTSDILAAQNAGCWSCLAGWGVPTEERELSKAMPDVVAEHPMALRELLRYWGL